MNFTNIKKVFPQTIPVMAGYLSLGMAYGVLMQQAGYHPLWSLAISVFVYAGTAQFLLVSLLASGAGIVQTAILVLALNFRHFFYGISMITRYRGTGKWKAYLIFALTDETYAILSTNEPIEGMSKEHYYALVSLMDQIYWVTGSVVGAIAGQFIPFDTTGLDFAMTALFAVLFVEQWKAQKEHLPAMLGILVTLIALLVLGPDHFLIPALFAISLILLALQNRLEMKKEGKIA